MHPVARKTLSAVSLALLLTAPAMHSSEEDEVETEVAVQVARVTRATLHRSVTGFGVIEPEGGKFPASARLSPAAPGIVAEVNAIEGQHVEKGDVLFRLESRAVDAAVAKAEAGMDFAQKNAERQTKLIATQGTSEKLVLESQQALAAAEAELTTAKTQQSLLGGVSPLAGTVVRVSARPGEAADITLPLVEIVDLDRLVASVRVPRAAAAEVRKEQKAQLLIGGGAAPIDCTVTLVTPQVETSTDTVLVRLAIPNHSGLLPGQFVTTRIFSEERKDRLTVPVASVVRDGDGGSMIATVEGSKATQIPVQTGLREGGLVEVEAEGLSEGQTVVTVGAYGLPKLTKVRVLNADSK